MCIESLKPAASNQLVEGYWKDSLSIIPHTSFCAWKNSISSHST